MQQFLICLMVAMIGATVDFGLGAESAATRPAAPELKLAPPIGVADESVLQTMTANKWTWAGPVDILGRGATRTLHFTQAADMALTLESVLHVSRDVNHRNEPGGKTDDQTETETCEILGPVLWIGGRPQTFAVVKGHSLILNALVPVGKDGGKLSWYYVACQRDKDGNAVGVEEYLFEFSDDPFKHDAGKGRMHARVGDNRPKTDEMRFTLMQAAGGTRYMQIDVDGLNGVAHRAQIGLIPGANYAMMRDNLNLNSQLFAATPQGK